MSNILCQQYFYSGTICLCISQNEIFLQKRNHIPSVIFLLIYFVIDIDNYTDAEIEGYLNNCKEVQNVTTDDFFTVAAIAATLDEEDAKKTAVFHDKDGVNEWLNSIEKEIW